jgi:hypothetical protein
MFSPRLVARGGTQLDRGRCGGAREEVYTLRSKCPHPRQVRPCAAAPKRHPQILGHPLVHPLEIWTMPT